MTASAGLHGCERSPDPEWPGRLRTHRWLAPSEEASARRIGPSSTKSNKEEVVISRTNRLWCTNARSAEPMTTWTIRTFGASRGTTQPWGDYPVSRSVFQSPKAKPSRGTARLVQESGGTSSAFTSTARCYEARTRAVVMDRAAFQPTSRREYTSMIKAT
jgi:hypothetical protein